MCCSATWPKEVKKIASQFVANNPVHVFVGGVSDKLVANKSIKQNVKVGLNCHAGPHLHACLGMDVFDWWVGISECWSDDQQVDQSVKARMHGVSMYARQMSAAFHGRACL